ncbi:hypothetical protein [Shewanella waksmanii]|uniref:hypothetical protein n=1 Tax=Shewanella waksmanii TaxID=213783 RepID=UPI000490F5C5|nr:hypothetical protein [Shewanella waksmanii]
MNKVLIGAAAVALAAGAYVISQQDGATTQSDSVLGYIPADTPMLAVQTAAFPIKDYIDTMASSQLHSVKAFAQELADDPAPMSQFLASLTQSYAAASASGQAFIDTFGLRESGRSYFYTLGALPVIKVELDDPQAIWAVLDNAEQQSGVTHMKQQRQQIEYRAYRLTEATDSEQLDVVVAIDGKMLTITLEASFAEPALLDVALGLVKPQQSVVDSGIIDAIYDRHGFMKTGVSYIDHQQLVTALTTTDGNQLASQMTKLFELVGDDPLYELRSNECHQDLSAIAKNWPRTVMGYNELEIDAKQAKLNFSTIIESNNQTMLGALSQLKGYLPSFTQDVKASTFSMGVGINVNEFVPAVTTIWNEFLNPEYQCEPLQQMQWQMNQQSPAMLGMFTGMANGVKGMSFGLIDYQLNDDINQPAMDQVDAIMTLSAEDPVMLLNMVKPFVPELANLQVPTDGTPVSLNQALQVPAAYGLDAKLAIKGQHMVIYTGEASAKVAEQVGKGAVDNNGLLSITADYQRLLAPLMTVLEMSGEPIPPELQDFQYYNMSAKFDLDINKHGIVMGSVMQSNSQ